MKNLTRAVLAVLLLVAAMACSKTSDTDIPDTSAGLLVFNMVPGTAKFDVLLDTATVGSSLEYGGNSGSYKQFRAQKYSLWVYPAGNRTTPLIGGEMNLRNGNKYSAYLTVDSKDTLRVLVAQDDNTPPSAKENIRVRVIDLSDPYVKKAGSSTALQSLALDFYLDTVKIYRGIAYGAVTPFAEVVGRTYETRFNWIDSPLIFQKVPLQAEAGKVYTLIATGDVQKTTFKMWQFVNQ